MVDSSSNLSLISPGYILCLPKEGKYYTDPGVHENIWSENSKEAYIFSNLVAATRTAEALNADIMVVWDQKSLERLVNDSH